MEKGQDKGSNKLPSYTVDAHEESATWIQYPLEDAFEGVYCSGNVGQASSTFKNQRPVRDARMVVSGQENPDCTRRALSKRGEHAMAMGVQRASGFTVQAGLEMFGRVKTMIKDPCDLDPSGVGANDVGANVSKRHYWVKSTIQDRLQCSSSEAPSSNLLNLSEPGLQFPAGSNAYKKRFEDIGYNASNSTTYKTHVKDINFNTSGLKSIQQAQYSIEEKILRSREVDVAPELDKLCCSAESETSAEMSTKDISVVKEKVDDYEEDLDVDFSESNQTSTRQKKRRRVAETHKLSEKRRRYRINEKLKALQELIPNSSKTDKASILDEAIQYLKALQSQLQMMSTRSSMNLAPMAYTAMQPTMMAPMYPFGFCMQMPYNGLNLNMGMGFMGGLNGISQRQIDASRDYSITTNPVSLSTISQNFSHPSGDTETQKAPRQEFGHINRSNPL